MPIARGAGYSGGIAPTVVNGAADVNGSGRVGGRDDSNGLYAETHVIDGYLDCDAWMAPNDGVAGDGVIDDADDCVLVGVDGSSDGVTITIEDGVFASVDDQPIPSLYELPALFNVSDPSDPAVADADLGWWAFDGRVDANTNGVIDAADCSRGVVGQTDDAGLGTPADGADVLGSSASCGNMAASSPSTDGLVDLNGDDRITNVDTCDGCFLGQDVSSGFLGAGAAPAIASFTPTSGPVGTTVTIIGTALAGASAVRFNGVTADIVSNNDTRLVVTVPDGATTGPISVVTPNGQATSISFFAVTAMPPSGGAHEREVTIVLRRHLLASGAVTVADGVAGCAVGVDVRVQRRIGKRWRTIQAARTRRTMTYVAILPDLPGKYRAFIPKVTLAEGDHCASATSPVVRR